MSDWGKVVENQSYGNKGSYLPTKGSDAEVVQHMVDHHGVEEDQAVDIAHDPHTYHTLMHSSGHTSESKVADKVVPHKHPFGKTVMADNVHPHVESDDDVATHVSKHHEGEDMSNMGHGGHNLKEAHTLWHSKFDHSPGGTNPTTDHVHSKPAWPEDHDAAVKHMQEGHGLKGSYAADFNAAIAHMKAHQGGASSHKGHTHIGPEPDMEVPEHHEHEHLDSTDHLKAMHGYEGSHLSGKNQTQLSHEHMALHKDMQGPADHYHPEKGGAQPWQWGDHKGPLNEQQSLQAHLNYGHNITPKDITGYNEISGHANNVSKHQDAHMEDKEPTHDHTASEGVLAHGTVKPEVHPDHKQDYSDPEKLHAHWISHHWDASKHDMPMPGDHSKYDHDMAHFSEKNDKFAAVPHSHTPHPSELPNPPTTIKHPDDLTDHLVLEHGMKETGKYDEHQLGKMHQHHHNTQEGAGAHQHEALNNNEQIIQGLNDSIYDKDKTQKESTLTSPQGSSDLLDFFKDNA
jgi:hypothetical protein